MMADKKKITIVDTTLRDGSHAVSHSFTEEQVRTIARGLDKAGVPLIELSHGDGLTGSTYNYGFSKVSELKLLAAANEVIEKSMLTVLLIPGIGTVHDLQEVKKLGVKAVRVATHCTEADISEQHIKAAKDMGLFTAGFLMMVHMIEPERLAEQAALMAGYGADYINLADSAGYLLPDTAAVRVAAVKKAVNIPVGFHAHNNLGVANANALAGIEAGAEYIDVTCRGLGAGAGNAQAEVMAGILQREGYETGIDFAALMGVAEDIVEPLMLRPQAIRSASLMLGYAGVYSSFLLHTYKAAEKFEMDPKEMLVELGRRRMVGGQEDMIVDVAYQLKQQKAKV
jgi:4-hydroxy 2-oxovalerate aldolase